MVQPAPHICTLSSKVMAAWLRFHITLHTMMQTLDITTKDAFIAFKRHTHN